MITDGHNLAGIRSLYAQIPGFIINNCKKEDCNTCKSYKNSNLPCWIINNNKIKCDGRECRNCKVYLMTDPIKDLRKYFVELKNCPKTHPVLFFHVIFFQTFVYEPIVFFSFSIYFLATNDLTGFDFRAIGFIPELYREIIRTDTP